MAPVPMITRVRLKNYRSIAACDVELGPLTILVGPNGSGKSNFFRVLDLLAHSLDEGLDAAVRRDGGMSSILPRWAVDDPDVGMSIEIHLALADDKRGHYAVDLKRSNVSDFKVAREICSIADATSGIVVRKFDVEGQGKTTWIGPEGSFKPHLAVDPLRGLSLTLPLVAGDPSFGLVYHALRGLAFYSLHVSTMRIPRVPDAGERLQQDGANIASLLERMRAENEHGWSPNRHVAEYLELVIPGLTEIRTPTVEGLRFLRFEQRLSDGQSQQTFSAAEMSYGTLRSLGVLVSLFQGNMKGGSPVTLVALEEPDSGVHPAAAAVLLDAMDEASLTTQVLAASHSIAMLDRPDLDLDSLRAVVMDDGRTRIGRIDAASRAVLREHLYTGGELLRMGHLFPDASADDAAQHEAPASIG